MRYVGARGLIVDFLVERKCYLEFVRNFSGHFSIGHNYIRLNADSLHIKVFGRMIGQNARDGLQVCHGKGGTLDNRKRTLVLGSRSLNLSHILRSRADDSIPVGVTRSPPSCKNFPWLAQINIGGSHFYLYMYSTCEEAMSCYQSVQSKREEILVLFGDITDFLGKLPLEAFIIHSCHGWYWYSCQWYYVSGTGT